MKTIDGYAIDLAATAVTSHAEDDTNESGEIADGDHEAAVWVAQRIARAIRAFPAEVLALAARIEADEPATPTAVPSPAPAAPAIPPVKPFTPARHETPADVTAAINQAVAAGLPQPVGVYTRDDLGKLFVSLTLATPADVDAWAAHTGATVAHDDLHWQDDNGQWLHSYGTAVEGSVFGRWIGRQVRMGCEVPGRPAWLL